jgi:hypothetical protein
VKFDENLFWKNDARTNHAYLGECLFENIFETSWNLFLS